MSLSSGTASFIVFKFDRMDVRELAGKLNSVKINRAQNIRNGFTSGKLILDNEINDDSIHGEILHVQFVEEKPRIDRAMLKAQIALHIDREKKARGVEFLVKQEIYEIKQAEETLMLANAPYTRSGVEVLFDCSSGLGYFGSTSGAKWDALWCELRGVGIQSCTLPIDDITDMLTGLLDGFAPTKAIIAPDGQAKFKSDSSCVTIGSCASDRDVSACAINLDRKCVKLGIVCKSATFTIDESCAFSKFKVVEDKEEKKDIVERVQCFEFAFNEIRAAVEEYKELTNGSH